MIDPWNPDTFNPELQRVLAAESQLVIHYYAEAHKLMEEHLNSSLYQSLKPNRFFSDYLQFREHRLTPILAGVRIRVWHYSRLLDHEVAAMQQRLEPSSLGFLQRRLDALVSLGLLSQDEADVVFGESPFQTQEESRSGRIWTVTVPVHFSDGGVTPLLESWGGESAYFWLSDELLAAKLRNLGIPRILEIETALSDGLNAFSVSETVLTAWAKKHGVCVVPSGCDLAIASCLDAAKVVRVHTEGENSFAAVAKSYPDGVYELTT